MDYAATLRADQQYRFHPDHGFVLHDSGSAVAATVFSGADILAIASGEFIRARRTPNCSAVKLWVNLGGEPLRGELFGASYYNWY